MESFKNKLLKKILTIVGIFCMFCVMIGWSIDLLQSMIYLVLALLCFYFAFFPSLKWFNKLTDIQKAKIIELDTKLRALNLSASKKLSFFNIKNFRYPKIYHLIELLSDDEDILYFSFGEECSKKIHIYITNKKIILDGAYSKSIQYEKINSIENGKNWLKIITSSECIQISQIASNDTKQLVKDIRDTMELHKSIDINITKVAEKDVADKIAKLKVLYDDGVLSEYEFNMKKIELLDKSK